MAKDLTEYLKTHPPSGVFRPGARYNADGNQLEVFWDDEEAFGRETDNHTLCVLRALSDERPVGVTVYGIQELLPPEMRAASDLLAACKALLDEHHLFAREDWQCPFCARMAGWVVNFPHADDCPVVQARAAIAKAEGYGVSFDGPVPD